MTTAKLKNLCMRDAFDDNGNKCEFMNECTKASIKAKRNRTKGNGFEREVIKDLKGIGYEGCVSTRSQNRLMDKNKIDVCDMNDELPVYIQAKYTSVSPDYFKNRDACSFKDKPYSIIWKKSGKDGANSPGTIAIVDYGFFLELLKVYKNGKEKDTADDSGV